MPRLRFVLLVLLVTGCPSRKERGGASCPAPVGTAEDRDGDLLTDVQELALGTDPEDPDSDGDGFGDYVEHQAGTDPFSAASRPTGAVAGVRQITSESELIGGPAAQGRVGDWLLENDRIRAIVQAPGAEQMQVGKFGGNLIDADVIRPGPGIDRVGSVIPLLGLGITSLPDRAVVVNDGSDGGAAVLRTCGVDAPFEYLDLGSVAKAYGFSLHYDTNADLDVTISNEYVLSPGSDVVEVVTTVANHGPTFVAPAGTVMDSGGAREVFMTNYQGFGDLGLQGLLQPQPPVRYIGFLGGDASWGFVGGAEPNAAINLFGITASFPGFTTPLEVILSNPSAGPGPGLLEFKKGGRTSWRRAIRITGGAGATEPFSEEYLRRYDPTAIRRTGTVGDTAPVAGARVVVLRRGGALDRAPLSVTESDGSGEYSFTLPAGDYYVAADLTGRAFPVLSGTSVSIETRDGQTTIPAAQVTLGAGDTALPDITFEPASWLDVAVTDAGGAGPVPAKVTVAGTDPSPGDSIFRDPKDRLPSALNTARNTRTGSVTIPLEPGSYTVYASRGLEWSLAESPVTVVAGQTTSLALSIGRVVDSTGWISADLHVHMLNSPDSPVSLEDRVISGAAEGLDVIVTTDHDFVTDLAPVIAALGLQDEVATAPGDEISTTAFGHFIAFPLAPDPDSTTGGSYAWSGPAGALNNRPPAEMFPEIEAANPGTQVAVVAHGRGDRLTSYYDAVSLATLDLTTLRDPEEIRVPPPAGATPSDTRLFYEGFDAQEVMNGPDDQGARRNALMNDLFTFLSHGLTLTPIGSSDTHSIYRSQLGFPRNFVKLAADAPPAFAANVEAFAVAMKEGRSFFTSGPFLSLTVTGDDTGSMGDLVRPRAADGTVTVEVFLAMPDWVEVDTLRLYLNTPGTGAPAGAAVEAPPAPQYELPIALSTVPAGNGLLRKEATVTAEVPVPGNGDAWLVVTASAGPGSRTLFPVVPQGTPPYAMTGAVYLDGNRSGSWDPPGNVTAGAFTARPAVRIYQPDEVAANLDDVRAQFERLSRAAEDH